LKIVKLWNDEKTEKFKKATLNELPENEIPEDWDDFQADDRQPRRLPVKLLRQLMVSCPTKLRI
jgi:hypothetical protein